MHCYSGVCVGGFVCFGVWRVCGYVILVFACGFDVRGFPGLACCSLWAVMLG